MTHFKILELDISHKQSAVSVQTWRSETQVADSEAKLLCGKILGNKAGQCGNILPACHSQESDKTRYGLLSTDC